MIGYVTLGTNDLERATKFYDRLCAEFGAKAHPGDGEVDSLGAEHGGAEPQRGQAP